MLLFYISFTLLNQKYTRSKIRKQGKPSKKKSKIRFTKIKKKTINEHLWYFCIDIDFLHRKYTHVYWNKFNEWYGLWWYDLNFDNELALVVVFEMNYQIKTEDTNKSIILVVLLIHLFGPWSQSWYRMSSLWILFKLFHLFIV